MSGSGSGQRHTGGGEDPGGVLSSGRAGRPGRAWPSGGLWWRLLRPFVIAYGVLAAIGLFFAERLIFPYRGSSYDSGLPGLEVIDGGDGQPLAVRTWSAGDESRGVVLLFHGNAEDLGHLDWIAGQMTGRGLSVMSMDYRGYGLSEGRPTEANCYADAERLYALAREKGYAPSDILVWGRSVGGGVATELAVRHGPTGVRGLVLESSFVTAFRTATVLPIIPFDRFRNLEKLEDLELPLMVIHGARDEIVGTWHGRRLFGAYGGEKRLFLVDEAGHNDLWAFDTEAMLGEVVGFFFGGREP